MHALEPERVSPGRATELPDARPLNRAFAFWLDVSARIQFCRATSQHEDFPLAATRYRRPHRSSHAGAAEVHLCRALKKGHCPLGTYQ